ncbi:hypothetical protein HK098_004633 [Nowakowskiella sp. JEL0407]|nr:hypothetical protein HK098_004633 [Nowakowskiella sp. JEL0407]
MARIVTFTIPLLGIVFMLSVAFVFLKKDFSKVHSNMQEAEKCADSNAVAVENHPSSTNALTRNDGSETIFLGDFTIMCHVSYLNHWVYFDTRDREIMPHVCTGQAWKKDINHAVNSIIQRGWSVLDIGANYGWYSLEIAKIIGDEGRVIAIEPHPRIFKLLQSTIQLSEFSGIIETVNKAAYNQTNTQHSINLDVTEPPRISTTKIDSENRNVVWATVVTVKIDDLVREMGIEKVDFIRIDVDGDEDVVWEGMKETLHKNQNLIVFLETNPQRMIAQGKDPEAFYRKLDRRYKTLRVVGENGALEDTSVEELAVKAGEIILALYPFSSP